MHRGQCAQRLPDRLCKLSSLLPTSAEVADVHATHDHRRPGRPHRRAVRRRAADRRAGVLAPARGGPRHRAGPAGPDDPRRRHPGLGARARPGRDGLPGHRVRHAGDPPAPATRRRRRTTRSPTTWPTIPEVLEAHTITGAGDMLVRIVARSNADLQRVIDRLLAADGVVRASTVIALDTQISPRVLPLVRGRRSTDPVPRAEGTDGCYVGQSLRQRTSRRRRWTPRSPMRLRRHTAARGLSAVAVAVRDRRARRPRPGGRCQRRRGPLVGHRPGGRRPARDPVAGADPRQGPGRRRDRRRPPGRSSGRTPRRGAAPGVQRQDPHRGQRAGGVRPGPHVHDQRDDRQHRSPDRARRRRRPVAVGPPTRRDGPHHRPRPGWPRASAGSASRSTTPSSRRRPRPSAGSGPTRSRTSRRCAPSSSTTTAGGTPRWTPAPSSPASWRSGAWTYAGWPAPCGRRPRPW